MARGIGVSSVVILSALLAGCGQQGVKTPATERQTSGESAKSAPATDNAFDAAWSRDAMWDDGKAEVSLYEAKRPQYSKIRSYEALLIVVKEEFNAKLNVKADPPFEGKAILPVMKLNAVHSYWTDNYPYHFLLSAFVRRDDSTQLVKMALGSQEWCGNTYKEVRSAGGRAELESHSYFDGEGDTVKPLDLRAGDLLEDQLPLALRALKFAPGLRIERRILPSLISNSMRRPGEWVQSTIAVAGEEKVVTGAGTFDAWRLEVKVGDLAQTWWMERAAPHAVLKVESGDGRALLLKSRVRRAYWAEPTFRPAM